MLIRLPGSLSLSLELAVAVSSHLFDSGNSNSFSSLTEFKQVKALQVLQTIIS